MANLGDVRSLGALVCVNALPASSFALAPDDGLSKTFDANFAIFELFLFSFLKLIAGAKMEHCFTLATPALQ